MGIGATRGQSLTIGQGCQCSASAVWESFKSRGVLEKGVEPWMGGQKHEYGGRWAVTGPSGRGLVDLQRSIPPVTHGLIAGSALLLIGSTCVEGKGKAGETPPGVCLEVDPVLFVCGLSRFRCKIYKATYYGGIKYHECYSGMIVYT